MLQVHFGSENGVCRDLHADPDRKTGPSPGSGSHQSPGASLTAATDLLPRTARSFAPCAVSPVIAPTLRPPRMFHSCRLLRPRPAVGVHLSSASMRISDAGSFGRWECLRAKDPPLVCIVIPDRYYHDVFASRISVNEMECLGIARDKRTANYCYDFPRLRILLNRFLPLLCGPPGTVSELVMAKPWSRRAGPVQRLETDFVDGALKRFHLKCRTTVQATAPFDTEVKSKLYDIM